jgi:hypothetical protein
VPGFFVFVILGIQLSWPEEYADFCEPRDDEPHLKGNHMHGGEIEGAENVRPACTAA